jgi:FkbM family methyltransferase
MIKDQIKNIAAKLGFEIRRKPRRNSKNKVSDVYINVAGNKLKVRSSHPFSSLYKRNPGYNAELSRIVKTVCLKYPESGVIDIGANIGDTLSIIKSVTDKKVLCIEGDEELFKYLVENSKQFKNVILKNVFLDDDSSYSFVRTEKDGWNTTIIPVDQDNKDSRSIHFFALDEVLSTEQNKETFKLLKIDTEGYDTKIIRGGKKFLEEVNPVIFMEYNRDNMHKINEDGFNTLMMLKDLGYNKVLVYESEGRFMLSTTLDSHIMRQLHNYADGYNSTIYYFDLCIFHSSDNDIADTYISNEEKMNKG